MLVDEVDAADALTAANSAVRRQPTPALAALWPNAMLWSRVVDPSKPSSEDQRCGGAVLDMAANQLIGQQEMACSIINYAPGIPSCMCSTSVAVLHMLITCRGPSAKVFHMLPWFRQIFQMILDLSPYGGCKMHPTAGIRCFTALCSTLSRLIIGLKGRPHNWSTLHFTSCRPSAFGSALCTTCLVGMLHAFHSHTSSIQVCM
eukprot:GHRR01019385.1.p1 GENE.GHRR01019385.1~~GHRR01019385.1.p1  ORF type:complete len:203 (-),score=33.61 GHRR01019385.1:593-1201(-)